VQYELRYQVVEPKRQTFQNLIDRFGDRPASRYEEGTFDLQPRENFHYRPTWAPDRELYDPAFSALRLTDPYSFTDPRQYYYAPYVTARADLHDRFGQTMAYLEQRDLLAKLPAEWDRLVQTVVVPLRHYEAGAQLASVAGARFAYGTSIEQCCSFAAFDRMGNAQILSRIGLSVAGGAADTLLAAKEGWIGAATMQPLRRLVEECLVDPDWATGVLAVELVDALLFPLLWSGLDEAALVGGAGAYSLAGQVLQQWYGDQRRWIDALLAAWCADADHGAANGEHLAAVARQWGARAQEAVGAIAADIDRLVPQAKAADIVAASVEQSIGRWAAAGVPLTSGASS
jgi:phenol hydroxylase P1 protein